MFQGLQLRGHHRFPSLQPDPYPEEDDDGNDADDEGDEHKSVRVEPASAPDGRKQWALRTGDRRQVKMGIRRRLNSQPQRAGNLGGFPPIRRPHEETSSSSSARAMSDTRAVQERKYQGRVLAVLGKHEAYPRSTANKLYRQHRTWVAVWHHLRDEHEAAQEERRRIMASLLPKFNDRG